MRMRSTKPDNPLLGKYVNAISSKLSSHDGETSVPTSPFRLFVAALGFPADYHVSNVQTERQSEHAMGAPGDEHTRSAQNASKLISVADAKHGSSYGIAEVANEGVDQDDSVPSLVEVVCQRASCCTEPESDGHAETRVQSSATGQGKEASGQAYAQDSEDLAVAAKLQECMTKLLSVKGAENAFQTCTQAGQAVSVINETPLDVKQFGALLRWRHAKMEAKEAILTFQRWLLDKKPPRLLSSSRGDAGETLLHLAYLFELYDMAHWLLTVEPTMLACTYERNKYKGETVLHMLCAQGGKEGRIDNVRHLAKEMLFPTSRMLPSIPVINPDARMPIYVKGCATGVVSPTKKSLSHAGVSSKTLAYMQKEADQRKTARNQRSEAWRLVYDYDEKGKSCSDPQFVEWCRSWLRAAWIGMVNSQCTGTFFEPSPIGSCYYGGTPLSIAAVLGHASIIRFLTVEVGCRTCPRGPFVDEDEAEDKPVYTEDMSDGKGILGIANTQAICPEVESLMGFEVQYPGELGRVELIENWDPLLCARIDIPDKYGNTAGHMAVQHHSSGDVFTLLSELYNRGYGRSNSADLYNVESAVLARAVKAYCATDANGASGVERNELEKAVTLDFESFSSLSFLRFDKGTTMHDAVHGLPRIFSCARTHVEAKLDTQVKTTRNPMYGLASLGLRGRGIANPGEHLINELICDAKRVHETEITNANLKAVDKKSEPNEWNALVRELATEVSQVLSVMQQDTDGFTGTGVSIESDSTSPTLQQRFKSRAAGLYLHAYSEAVDKDAAARTFLHSRAPLLVLINKEGITPLTLAARLGKRTVFEELWAKKKLWTWGGVRAWCFALDQIDDIGQIADDNPEIDTRVRNADKIRAGQPQRVRAFLCCVRFYGEAWCCGPRRQFHPIPSVSTQESATDRSHRTSSWPSFLFILWQWLSLFVLWAFGCPPFIVAHRTRPAVRQPTVMEEIVKNNHWHMLEPAGQDGAARNSSLSSGTAALSATLVSWATKTGVKSRQEVAGSEGSTGIPGGTGDLVHPPTSRDLPTHYRDFRDLATRINRVTADEFDEEDDELGDDKMYLQDGNARILLQLANRKWTRVYGVLFYRLLLQRLLAVSFAWAVIIARAGVPTGDSGNVHLAVTILAIGAWLSTLKHGWRMAYRVAPLIAHWLVRNARYISAALRGRPGLHATTLEEPEVTEQTQDTALFFAGHGGSFGVYYLVTLILSSMLIAVGGTVDLAFGWAEANVMFSFGGFLAGAHLLYFCLGFTKTGPLFVMLGSVLIADLRRWMQLFIPTVMLFAFALFTLDAGGPESRLGVATAFRTYLSKSILGAFDISLQPNPSANIMDAAAFEMGSSQPEFVRGLYLLTYLSLIFVATIGLLTLVVAMFSHAFNEHLNAPTARWRIELARACMLLESNMSAWERLSLPLQHRYFLWVPFSSAASGPQSLLKLIGPNTFMSAEGDEAPCTPPPRPYFFCQEDQAANLQVHAGKRAREMFKGNLRPTMQHAKKANWASVDKVQQPLRLLGSAGLLGPASLLPSSVTRRK